MSNVKKEREDTIIRNIMSGQNGCGTLAAAAMNGDDEYFRRCVMPILDAYEQEAAALRQQRQEALETAEKRRQALEYAVSNLAIPAAMKPMLATALGRPL